MRAEIDGYDLAVWRDPGGGVHAWDNRCPHRGMRLSHGFVRGDNLACLYHGWHFGQDGVCAYIPAHPDLEPPATIRTKRFEVTERSGVIWVCVAGTLAIPDTHGLELPVRSMVFDCPEAAAMQAMTTTPFGDHAPEIAAPGLFTLGPRRLLALATPMGTARTQVTVLVDADATGAECKALSRWCEAARDVAETTAQAAA